MTQDNSDRDNNKICVNKSNINYKLHINNNPTIHICNTKQYMVQFSSVDIYILQSYMLEQSVHHCAVCIKQLSISNILYPLLQHNVADISMHILFNMFETSVYTSHILVIQQCSTPLIQCLMQ